VARQVGGEAWRESLEPVRQAARRLVARGLVVITQRGQVVDPDRARGPIRIRRR
jgi:DNA-binding GntR family transcriptional regulator